MDKLCTIILLRFFNNDSLIGNDQAVINAEVLCADFLVSLGCDTSLCSKFGSSLRSAVLLFF